MPATAQASSRTRRTPTIRALQPEIAGILTPAYDSGHSRRLGPRHSSRLQREEHGPCAVSAPGHPRGTVVLTRAGILHLGGGRIQSPLRQYRKVCTTSLSELYE